MDSEVREVIEYVKAGDLYHMRPVGRENYQTALDRFVQEGRVDPKEANEASIRGRTVLGQRLLVRVALGYGYHANKRTGLTERQQLRELVNMGFVDQEEAHLAMIEGDRSIEAGWD